MEIGLICSNFIEKIHHSVILRHCGMLLVQLLIKGPILMFVPVCYLMGSIVMVHFSPFSPHPYIFFNPDRHSITFLGFNIDKQTGNLIDHQTRAVLKEKIMSPQLFESLNRQGVNLLENFDNLTR
jgi:hypothetical protein